MWATPHISGNLQQNGLLWRSEETFETWNNWQKTSLQDVWLADTRNIKYRCTGKGRKSSCIQPWIRRQQKSQNVALQPTLIKSQSSVNIESPYPMTLESSKCSISLYCTERLAGGWTVRGSNAGGGEVFRTCPDRPSGTPSLLYNGNQVFPGDKAAGAWRRTSFPSSTEVNKRVALYLYSFSVSSLGELHTLIFYVRYTRWKSKERHTFTEPKFLRVDLLFDLELTATPPISCPFSCPQGPPLF